MSLTAEDITVAITVYDRLAYVEQAIQSALSQTAPVRVMVVDDCGPNPDLERRVTDKFGSRIVYHRNPTRRGLFDNWNACLALCQTPWLSILHDDDYLEPRWTEAVLELSAAAPGRLLYYVTARVVDAAGRPLEKLDAPAPFEWEDMDLARAALVNPVWLAGQLTNRQAALSLGGFRASSQFCGDWEMWLKLALTGGAARTNRVVATVRAHGGEGRGTSAVFRSGRKYCCDNVQRKRNVRLLHEHGIAIRVDRTSLSRVSPVSARALLADAATASPRFLKYNAALLLLSPGVALGDRIFQQLVRVLGPGFVRAASKAWRVMRPLKTWA